MNPILKRTLAAAAALSLSSVGSFSAHAFDLEDYATTYRATRDAYLKASFELKYAESVLKFRQYMLAAMGDTLYVKEYVKTEVPIPDWCMVEDFTKHERGPAYPEVAGWPQRFAVNHGTHADLNYRGELYAGLTQQDAYLHYHTQEVAENPAAAIQDFINYGPFMDGDQKAASQTWLDTAVSAKSQGFETWMGYSPTRDYTDPWNDPRVRVTPKFIYDWHYGTSDGDWWTGRTFDSWGDFCVTNDDCAGTGGVCTFWSSSWQYQTMPSDSRCFYADNHVAFPPTPMKPSDNWWGYAFRGGGDFGWGGAFEGVNDMEDIHGSFRASRDAYLKAANELKLATGPYKAARDAYVTAMQVYLQSIAQFEGGSIE